MITHTKSQSVRGAVNVEYILLYLVAALVIGFGVFYLSTAINDKLISIGGAFSKPAGEVAVLSIGWGYMPDFVSDHPKDGKIVIYANEGIVASNGSVNVAVHSELESALTTVAPIGDYSLMAQEGLGDWQTVATVTNARPIFDDFTPAKTGLNYKIVETVKHRETPKAFIEGFWNSVFNQTYVGDQVAVTIPDPPVSGIDGEIVDNYGAVIATATVTPTNPTINFPGTAERTYTFRTASGAASQPSAPLPTIVKAPIHVVKQANGKYHIWSDGMGDPNYRIVATSGENIAPEAGSPDWSDVSLGSGTWEIWAEDVHGAQSQKVTIDAGGTAHFFVHDKNNLGLSNMVVMVDGTPYLTTSGGTLDIPNMDYGSHSVSVSAFGYKTYNQPMTISTGQVTNTDINMADALTVTLTLKSYWAGDSMEGRTITFNSVNYTTDANGSVYINDVADGNNYPVTVALPGYAPFSTGVAIGSGRTAPINVTYFANISRTFAIQSNAAVTVKQSTSLLRNANFTVNNGIGTVKSDVAGVVTLPTLNPYSTYTITYNVTGVTKTLPALTPGNKLTTTVTW